MIYLDTNIFLYSVLDNGEKGLACKKLLRKVASDKMNAVTSVLTWDEFVFSLKKHAPFEEVLIQSRDFLNFPNLVFLEANSGVLEKANEIWSTNKLKPRDAIHAATAILNKCEAIVSDDTDFDKLKEIKRKKI